MSDIAKRLRASVKLDAINGSAHERSVCARQMLEAATEIERLQRRVEELSGPPTFLDEALNSGDGVYRP